MYKYIPPVQRYMTAGPVTIDENATVEHAKSLMRSHDVRQLPVLSGGCFVGLVNEHDLAITYNLQGSAQDGVRLVKDTVSTNVLVVSPDSPLDELAFQLAAQKCACAVVLQYNQVVGVLTMVDICRALGELLRARASSGGQSQGRTVGLSE